MKTQKEIQEYIDMLKLAFDKKVTDQYGNYIDDRGKVTIAYQLDALNWVIENPKANAFMLAMEQLKQHLIDTNQIKIIE